MNNTRNTGTRTAEQEAERNREIAYCVQLLLKEADNEERQREIAYCVQLLLREAENEERQSEINECVELLLREAENEERKREINECVEWLKNNYESSDEENVNEMSQETFTLDTLLYGSSSSSSILSRSKSNSSSDQSPEKDRSKRQRLISYDVNAPWPDPPAKFESLNGDTFTIVVEFLGGKSYGSFGFLNKFCREIYLETKGMTKETFLYGYAPFSVIKDKIENVRLDCELHEGVGKGVVCFNRSDVFNWVLEERKLSLLKEICDVAAEEGRVDILIEVLNNNNIEDAKRDIFQQVDRSAACYGKLNVLKWFESTGLYINKEFCVFLAAIHGHLNIIQWLRKEKDLQLDGRLYNCAIHGGGYMHVLKWVREQKVPWHETTFRMAAYKGNLKVLKWLYDEGCPWSQDIRVDADNLEPEVIHWLILKQYSDRIDNEEINNED